MRQYMPADRFLRVGDKAHATVGVGHDLVCVEDGHFAHTRRMFVYTQTRIDLPSLYTCIVTRDVLVGSRRAKLDMRKRERVIGKRFIAPLNSSAIFVSLDNMPPSTCCRTESSPGARRWNRASARKFCQHIAQQKDSTAATAHAKVVAQDKARNEISPLLTSAHVVDAEERCYGVNDDEAIRAIFDHECSQFVHSRELMISVIAPAHNKIF